MKPAAMEDDRIPVPCTVRVFPSAGIEPAEPRGDARAADGSLLRWALANGLAAVIAFALGTRELLDGSLTLFGERCLTLAAFALAAALFELTLAFAARREGDRELGSYAGRGS